MSDTEMLAIALPREMADELRQEVGTGESASHDELVQEAVREWQERRSTSIYTNDELRALIDEGLASGPSQFATIEDVKAAARHLPRSKIRWSRPNGGGQDCAASRT